MADSVPYTSIRRSATRWQLVRGDVDRNGDLHRSGTGYVIERSDGRWEWRACGQAGTVSSRELAEARVLDAWVRRAPVEDGTDRQRRCLACPTPLPPGSTVRRKFCSAGCRVTFARMRKAPDGRVPRVRRRTTRPQAGQIARAAARARAHSEPSSDG